ASWEFWLFRGAMSESFGRLAAALGLTSPRTSERAEALHGAAAVAGQLGDYATAERLGAEALAIGLDIGDERSIALGHFTLGMAIRGQGDEVAACTHLEAALAHARASGDHWTTAVILHRLTAVVLDRGDLSGAVPL